jgi:hypothetical protein
MTSFVVAFGLAFSAQQIQPPVLPPPTRVEPLASPRVQPLPVAMTLAEFSRAFAALPGKHEVWLIHPRSRQPVLVCFTLPPGRMRSFEVEDDWIEFEFEKCDVRIDFRKNGRVEIDYDD